MTKQITSIVSIKNELGHFTFGYYMGTEPDMNKKRDFIVSGTKKWDNPQDPIIYQLEVKPEDTAKAIAWAVAPQGVELGL